MRAHFSRPAFFEGIRDMSPMMLGIVPFGMVCGVGAIAAGASPVAALAMSMIMFSGAAQIIATQLLAAGAPFAVIVLSCLVVSLRLLMYSAALAPYLRPLDHRWRNLLSFVLTDQAFAGTLQRFRESDDLRANASYFLGSGALLWVVWQLATVAGILAGQIIPASWQLEFVVPLCFIAVLVPLLRDRVSILVFAVAASAVVALDAMPLRLSMICGGLLAIAAGVLADKMTRARGQKSANTGRK
jgi:predicted branched-subunit amino acid permease